MDQVLQNHLVVVLLEVVVLNLDHGLLVINVLMLLKYFYLVMVLLKYDLMRLALVILKRLDCRKLHYQTDLGIEELDLRKVFDLKLGVAHKKQKSFDSFFYCHHY